MTWRDTFTFLCTYALALVMIIVSDALGGKRIDDFDYLTALVASAMFTIISAIREGRE